MERFKTCVVFFKELSKVLADKKVSFSEGVGILPELVDFLSCFKDLDALRIEVTALQDRFNNHDSTDFKAFLIANGIDLESDLAWSVSESLFWTVHVLTFLKKQ
jgi:hypothetical protein